MFFLCLEPQTTQKDAKIIYDSCCSNLLFLRILRILWFSHQRMIQITRNISVIRDICCYLLIPASVKSVKSDVFYFKQQKTQIFTKDLDECFCVLLRFLLFIHRQPLALNLRWWFLIATRSAA